MRVLSILIAVAGAPLVSPAVSADDTAFANVRVEYAPKRAGLHDAQPGPVRELRQDDGSVVADLNGQGMEPTRLRREEGVDVLDCGGRPPAAMDFRRGHRWQER